jgi:vitamin B12/bleomycin/antimicrobial peptide transport system ATP-binding/permease protein
LVVAATAYGQIRLNGWNKPFYDAMSRRDLRDFLYQLGVFFLIAGISARSQRGAAVAGGDARAEAARGAGAQSAAGLDAAAPGVLAGQCGAMGVNPDQRIHEDARKLCELSADLGVGLLQAAILFLTFAGVLWGLSKDFSFPFGDRDYTVPGFMVWAAIIYASAGSLLSYWVGRGLIGRNAERYAREADLRFSLVRVNEHVDDISLAAGEADEKRRIELHLGNVLAATRRIVMGHANLTWVTAGFGWVTIVAPILVAAPLYFSGQGLLRRSHDGGRRVHPGAILAALVHRQFQRHCRLARDAAASREFPPCADHHHEPRGFESRITYTEGEPARSPSITSRSCPSANADKLKETKVVVKAASASSFSARPEPARRSCSGRLAGLWPWGAGRITRPMGEQIFYLPRGTPYLPRGTLREVLAYPLKAESFGESAFTRALYRLGSNASRRCSMTTRRWDRELSQDEQLCLALRAS